ncbi:hypothetical protein EI555_017484 [Monodon monoceros]|uniref:Elongation factor 1-gamma n=1 Tax=Monodon monoceros TaxID=40151 RepID=A0A4U1EDC3_MONMO|nr:hypothetical protein EI555_017484 [Monodon monoceros]
MAAGTLCTYPENWRTFKALIATQYSGAQVRVLSAPPHFYFGQTNCTPEFLGKFPAGKVPAFEGDDGFCVFESNGISSYVSNKELQRSTLEAAAQVVQWVSFADSDIVPPASTWVFPTLGNMHHNKQVTENAKEVRLDKLRKNAFASVILFGTNNSSSISGVWVFRGQELAFPLSPDWQVDYESYTWQKLDRSSEDTQPLVQEYFSWDGVFQHAGKAFNQGKIFKRTSLAIA